MIEDTIKEQHWQEVSQQVARLTDRLGCGIDPGILETVVALTILGIHTLASCEGHLDHGIAAPWVDIGAPDVRELAKVTHLKQQAVQRAREQGVPPEQRHILM